MNEETGEHDAVTTEPCISKEPSFHGRLQLKDFMFNGTITPSEAASPAPGRTAQKRKAQSRRTPGSPSSSRRTTPKGEDGSPSPRKKRSRVASSYAPPSAYAHLAPLIDVIAPNLLILFIGLNPGVQTARTGHAYAHPSNLFWKLLYSSGITPVPCRAEEDRTLAARFGLGNTNIVARPSRNGAELSRAEMDAGVAVLEDKCRRWRPEVACVVGKSIWESIFRVWKGRNLAKGEFEYGWQTERMVDDGPWEGARIFVATSTSGLAASLRPEEKERIWKVLGDWCVQRRKERAEDKTEMDA
ncbi:DNA glycosylase [Xylaria longipes]|nr:DNA glycosylase [Xylaria longipes]